MLARGKSTIAPTAKTVLALRVYQAKVKPRKPVLIAFAVIPSKKVATRNQNQVKVQALEIATPTRHVVLDVANKNNRNTG